MNGCCPTCGQKIPNPKTAAAAKATWPVCVAAALQYGKVWKTLSPSRERLLEARLRDAPESDPAILWQAIHGAMTYWRQRHSDGFDPIANLVPETIYRPSQFTKYLEHYSAEPVRKPSSALQQHRQAPRASEEQRQAGAAKIAQIAARLGSRMQVPR